MDDLEYNYIKYQVRVLIGLDLNCYKTPQMQRRLKAYLARSGYPNWPAFIHTMRANPVELNKLKDYLTINVSSFFRDPDKYDYLRTSILPVLLRKRAALRVWSAGCSHGQEVYSLAMLLAEAGGGPRYQHRILATDIDHSALKWSRAGGPYSADDVTHVSTTLRQHYFNSHNNQYWVNKELRGQVMFRQHNLLADPIAGKFDLIVCRNVVIYFQPEAKQKLYHRFYNVLKPGGVLFIGGTEIVPKATDVGFEAINISFYRRQDTGQSRLKLPISQPGGRVRDSLR